MEEKCYKCDRLATGREHVPPVCLFPEFKDLGEDYRKDLLTVPSCDEHNLKKTKDDEFLMICLSGVVGNNAVGYLQTKTKVRRALERKHEGFIDRIIKDAKDFIISTKKGVVFPLLSGKPDIERLRKCFDLLVSGIYYIEFGKRLNGETKTLFGFVEYQDKNTNKLMTFFKDRFENEVDKFPKKGANPKVFYYQLEPPDQFGLIGLRMTFYEGANVFTAIIDDKAKKPFDLSMQLMNSGIKSIIDYNGKKYEFN